MFYSDVGFYAKRARLVIYDLVLFAGHFNWYANGKLVQCAAYSDVVWG